MNKALEHSSVSNKVLYALILFVISNYAGTIGKDVSLIEGKNIVTFLFYYLLGHLLSQSKEVWKKWDRKRMIVIYLICNVVIIAFVSIYGNNRIVNGLFEYCFVRYNSPILWLNAILTFVLISGVSFQSGIINKLAKSCLSIYLLHCSFVSWLVVKPAMSYALAASSSIPYIFIATCFIALLIVIVCVAIHFCLNPFWIGFDRLGMKLQEKALIWWSYAVVKMRNIENDESSR